MGGEQGLERRIGIERPPYGVVSHDGGMRTVRHVQCISEQGDGLIFLARSGEDGCHALGGFRVVLLPLGDRVLQPRADGRDGRERILRIAAEVLQQREMQDEDPSSS